MRFRVSWHKFLGRKAIDYDDGSDAGDGMVDDTEGGESFTVDAPSAQEAMALAEKGVKERHVNGVLNCIISEADGRASFPATSQ